MLLDDLIAQSLGANLRDVFDGIRRIRPFRLSTITMSVTATTTVPVLSYSAACKGTRGLPVHTI
jgi:hypothetical protein